MNFLKRINEQALNPTPNEKHTISNKALIEEINTVLEFNKIEKSAFFEAIQAKIGLDFDGSMEFITNTLIENYNSEVNTKNVSEILADFDKLYERQEKRIKQDKFSDLQKALSGEVEGITSIFDENIIFQNKINSLYQEVVLQENLGISFTDNFIQLLLKYSDLDRKGKIEKISEKSMKELNLSLKMIKKVLKDVEAGTLRKTQNKEEAKKFISALKNIKKHETDIPIMFKNAIDDILETDFDFKSTEENNYELKSYYSNIDQLYTQIVIKNEIDGYSFIDNFLNVYNEYKKNKKNTNEEKRERLSTTLKTLSTIINSIEEKDKTKKLILIARNIKKNDENIPPEFKPLIETLTKD